MLTAINYIADSLTVNFLHGTDFDREVNIKTWVKKLIYEIIKSIFEIYRMFLCSIEKHLLGNVWK